MHIACGGRPSEKSGGGGGPPTQVQAGGEGEEPPSPLKRRNSVGGVEVTEAALRRGEEEGSAAIVEVYASLLLAFVVEGDAASCEVAFLCVLSFSFSAPRKSAPQPACIFMVQWRERSTGRCVMRHARLKSM